MCAILVKLREGSGVRPLDYLAHAEALACAEDGGVPGDRFSARLLPIGATSLRPVAPMRGRRRWPSSRCQDPRGRETICLSLNYRDPESLKKRDHAQLACTTESEEIDWSSEKEIVFGLLEKANRVVLRDDLAGILARNAKEATAGFFHLFGDEIAAERRLRSNATLATSVMVPLLEGRNLPGLNWLRTVLEQDHDLLKQAMSDNRSAFERDLAIALRDGADDEAQGEIRRIAEVLGVQQAPRAEPHEEPEESARS